MDNKNMSTREYLNEAFEGMPKREIKKQFFGELGEAVSDWWEGVRGYFYIALIVITLLVMAYISMSTTERNVQSRIDAGYTAYLDGQEIDINTVNIDRYIVDYDDTHHYIILTTPRRGR